MGRRAQDLSRIKYSAEDKGGAWVIPRSAVGERSKRSEVAP